MINKEKQIENEREITFDAEHEWTGMPEFIQEKQEPFSKIIIRFESEYDLDDFAKLIGQKLTPKTKSIWHPHKPHSSGVKKVYTNGE